MANRPGRRRFGNIRKRPSGRWQASYIAPDGLRRYAGGTFDRKGDAERWLSVVESEILRGEWLDPLLSAVSLEEYARAWIKERQLRQRTRENYRDAWRLHIKPYLGSTQLRDITPQVVLAGGQGFWRPVVVSPPWRRRTGCSGLCSTPRSMTG
jgi:Phage integrase, N-terminal SAM-like domain